MAKWKNILDQYLNTEDDQVLCHDTLIFDRIITAMYRVRVVLLALFASEVF